MTSRSIEVPDPQIFATSWPVSCSSLHLIPGREDEKPSIRERFQSIRTSKLPIAKFRIQILLPRVAILGKIFPIKLQIDHDIEGSSVPAPPMVLLKKCHVDLRAYTFIQCVRDEIFHHDDVQRDWEETFRIASVDYSENMDKAPAITELLDLNMLMQIGVR